MSSSLTCGCSVCPTHAAQAQGSAAPGGPAGWAAPAREFFESVVAWLDGPEAMAADHAQLEQRLLVDQREQYRLLYQGHLDDRAARENRRASVVGSDGTARRRVEHGHQRPLTSLFGSVTVTRMAYRATPTGPAPAATIDAEPVDAEPAEATTVEDGAPTDGSTVQAAGRSTGRTARNLYPADAVLNLPVGWHSAGLARFAAVEAARGSFEEAAAAIERATGVRLGKRQVEQLARAAAVDVDSFYAAHRPAPCPDGSDGADGRVLVLQADGKGIVMRQDGLRPATARTAAKTSTAGSGLSPADRPARKRMAELVCVHDLTPVPRTVDDIIPPVARPTANTAAGAAGDPVTDRVKAPIATGKWLTASIVEDIPTVIAAGFDEAERRDPDHQRTWLALVDGNTTQIDAILAEARRRGVTVTILVDLLHVSGYLWDAAKAFFCTDTTAGMTLASSWVSERTRLILQGRAGEVAGRITARANDSKLTAAQRKATDAAATYLTNKAPHLDYPTALAKGWQIATGVIEGACRHLVQDRMDITGARWGLPGAETVLKLRALTRNGDFDSYWDWHLQQELQRNHLSRYQELDLAA